MDDGWKTPKWDDSPITIPRRLLQEAELALSDSRGLIQRLESLGHHFGQLDARDMRALKWGRESLANIRAVLAGSKKKGNMECIACGFRGDDVQDFISTAVPGQRFCPNCDSSLCFLDP